jgi:hypothetical protein
MRARNRLDLSTPLLESPQVFLISQPKAKSRKNTNPSRRVEHLKICVEEA